MEIYLGYLILLSVLEFLELRELLVQNLGVDGIGDEVTCV